MKWFERPDVLEYIVHAYAGIDNVGGRKMRQFIWEDVDGNTVIGNSRAFTDHLSVRFELSLSSTSWASVHEALRAMGEIARAYSPRTQVKGGRFKNQDPVHRVIRRRK